MTLSVAMIFGNNMVLQRNKKIVVWGEAESGSSITVKLNGVTASVTAVEGKWKAELPPMEACTGCEMHIEDDKGQSIELKNVAIGEVWIAGGQSNMEMGMYADADFEEAKKEANNPIS